MSRRVLVTGLGCVTPLGDVASTWNALVEGRSGISRLSRMDPSPYRTKVAGQIDDFDPSRYLPARDVGVTSRCVQLAAAATRMAVADADLAAGGSDPRRTGVYIGTSVGPLGLALEQHAVFLEKGIGRVHPMAPAQNYPGAVASYVATLMGFKGPAITVSTACTSGMDALGYAMSQIQSGAVHWAIAGASEAPLFPELFAAFDRLGLMSRWNGDPRRACRPFSADRDGIVLSEGAAICVLEAEEAAAARGATALAEIVGFGATCDAYHPLQQLPGGEEATRAITIALENARMSPGDVDYVSAHGTGTPQNDRIETLVVKAALGSRASMLPVSSIKSMTGHLMGASGALEVLAAVKTLTEGVIPPTINLDISDSECDLDYVANVSRPSHVRTVLSNTFGFGSRNASILLKAV